MTSWLLVYYTMVHGGNVPTFVPNLASAEECIRVAESVKKIDIYISTKFKCVEVYNSERKQ